MFKSVQNHLWAFDAEWVPDPVAGRLLYHLPQEMADREVVQEMWIRNGASHEAPQPMLKLIMCRVISIAVVARVKRENGEVVLRMVTMPQIPDELNTSSESDILSRFLSDMGKWTPQLVGFNSTGSDLPILVQRAVVNGLSAEGFCKRPDKPWEGPDYFARSSEWNIDLMQAIGDWGKARPSLNEVATLAGIPGKMDEFSGDCVAEAWLNGEIRRIVEYNQHDALTTYLLWLRIAHLAGFFTDEQYLHEQNQVRFMLEDRIQQPDHEHLEAYLREWDRLKGLTGQS